MASQPIKLPYGFVSVTGDSSETFLQGQVSCDVATLGENNATFGTINTPKGRILGLFMIVRIENGFLLRFHQECLESIFNHLSKFKVFFKCEMKIETTWQGLGYCIEDGTNLAPFESRVTAEQIRIGLPGRHHCEEIWQLHPNANAMQEDHYWQCLQTLNGIPELYAATQDRFILQYLNLQHLNAVSFHKGCYTGQEIIARMKFLGKLKKKTFLLRHTNETMLTPGDSVFDDQGKKCGELVRSHVHANFGTCALAILDLSYESSGAPVYADAEGQTELQVNPIEYN